MILIAESGSTKCDWVLLNRDGSEADRFSTMGFNPYFHSARFVAEHLRNLQRVQKLRKDVEMIFFYGAGCSTEPLKQEIKRGLEQVFVHAEIEVDHDLVAAAYSTYNGEPEIACIIGTGSNSCYFDGHSLREEVPALAFILGDEASGSYLGKKLLSAFLYKQLPKDIEEDFLATYHTDKDEIIDNVYNQPNANVYLAGFARFVSKHKEDPFFEKIIYEGFLLFLRMHVLCFPESKNTTVNFVGSVAYHMESLLRRACKDLDIKYGRVIKKPVDGLVAYHLKHKIQLEA